MFHISIFLIPYPNETPSIASTNPRPPHVHLSTGSMCLAKRAQSLFRHILFVLQTAPSFSATYSLLLQKLLAAAEYRLKMPRDTYRGTHLLPPPPMPASSTEWSDGHGMADLVTHFLDKVAEGTSPSSFPSSRDESLRSSTVLHTLLQNPPGGLHPELREFIAHKLAALFENLR